MENKAKEYAQELVNRFLPYVSEYMAVKMGIISKGEVENAKQCALICLVEMSKEAAFVNNNIVMNDRLDFLISVKQEIEAL